jgi:hypothetical protein
VACSTFYADKLWRSFWAFPSLALLFRPLFHPQYAEFVPLITNLSFISSFYALSNIQFGRISFKNFFGLPEKPTILYMPLKPWITQISYTANFPKSPLVQSFTSLSPRISGLSVGPVSSACFRSARNQKVSG